MLTQKRKLIAIITAAAICSNMLLPKMSYAQTIQSDLPIVNYQAQTDTQVDEQADIQADTQTGILEENAANIEEINTTKTDQGIHVPIVANYQGHTSTITTLAISPDDKTLVSGSDDKTVRMYNIENQNEITILGVEAGEIKKVIFSPAGDKIAYCDTNGYVKICDIKQKKVIQALKLNEGAVNSIQFSNNGKLLYSGDSRGLLIVWDIKNSKIIDYQNLKSEINSILYNKSNDTLAIALQNNSLVILDAEDFSIAKTLQNVIEEESTKGIENITIDPESTYLVLSNSGSLKPVVLNLKDDYEKISLGQDDFRYKDYLMWSLSTFTSDGNFIIGCDTKNDHIGIFNFNTRKLVKELDIHPTSIALSKDGHYFAVGNLMDEINLYDTSNCKKPQLQSIEIEKQDTNFVKAQATKLNVTAHYDDGTAKRLNADEVDWSVSDKDAATISDGIFYPFKTKKVNISASYKGMNQTLLANISGDKNDIDKINSIAYDKTDNIYVAVGDKGIIKYSYNRVDWVDVANSTSNNIETIICGNGIFVALDEAGQILTSKGGKTWSIYKTDYKFNSIKWNGIRFTASSEDGYIFTSKEYDVWNEK